MAALLTDLDFTGPISSSPVSRSPCRPRPATDWPTWWSRITRADSFEAPRVIDRRPDDFYVMVTDAPLLNRKPGRIDALTDSREFIAGIIIEDPADRGNDFDPIHDAHAAGLAPRCTICASVGYYDRGHWPENRMFLPLRHKTADAGHMASIEWLSSSWSYAVQEVPFDEDRSSRKILCEVYGYREL